MILVIIFIGIVLITVAIRGTQGALFTALKTDVPAFMVWGAAIFAVGALGFIPGIKPISRTLLALVLTVLILANYKKIVANFESAAGVSSGSSVNSIASSLSGLTGDTTTTSSIVSNYNSIAGIGVDQITGSQNSAFIGAPSIDTSPQTFLADYSGLIGSITG